MVPGIHEFSYSVELGASSANLIILPFVMRLLVVPVAVVSSYNIPMHVFVKE